MSSLGTKGGDDDDGDEASLIASKLAADEWEHKRSSLSRNSKTASSSSSSSASMQASEPKPMKLKTDGSFKALPALRAGGASSGTSSVSLSQLSQDFADLESKKKRAKEEFRLNQELLSEKRKAEALLREKVCENSHVSMEDEAERRAQYMREQRDRLLALKKAERDSKVQTEAEQRAKAGEDEIPEVVKQAAIAAAANSGDRESKGEDPDIERRRSAMRTALARRMKMDLIENEETKLSKLKEEQFADLDRKLREVETVRHQSQQRDIILAEQIKRQQSQIARNVQKSAASMRAEDL